MTGWFDEAIFPTRIVRDIYSVYQVPPVHHFGDLPSCVMPLKKLRAFPEIDITLGMELSKRPKLTLDSSIELRFNF
jgi:hypothetical protein